MDEFFFDIGLIIILASTFGYVARLLKQPIIPAYILAGAIFGPILGIIDNGDIIRTLSEIGIAFLLFTVGLELELKKLRDIGNVATLGGLIQFASLFGLGFFTAALLGYFKLEAVYIALILVFSSTMVVIKILSDKKELDSLHGRIIIGLLLMQDILAIFAISILGSLNDFSLQTMMLSLIILFLLIVFALIASKVIFPKIFKFAAKSPELLFLVSVAVAFTFSIIFEILGFSIAIGSFVAGVSLGNLPYNLEIASRVRSLKDFFATVFFVALGVQLVFGDISKLIVPIIVLTFFTIIIKTLFNFILIALFGYEKRTSFITAISLAQISEFALIIIGFGYAQGHIGSEFLSLTIMVATITIMVSTYFIKFSAGIYNSIRSYLKIFNFLITEKHVLHNFSDEKKHDVLLIGYDRIGYAIFKGLKKLSDRILVVDFNPDIIKKLVRKHINCIYGDIGDMEILEKIDFKDLKMVVSTIPEIRENMMLVKKVKAVNEETPIFVTCMDVDEALELYDSGADYVILPHFLGGEHVSLMLEDISQDITKLVTNKVEHIKELHIRKEHHHHNY
ncbi:hypothetical protein C0585_08055 [Candidatus Woesearchaeota archaeon]|nr:MAG: hypothetical protein C0585_08055 [Candidatus Woesearchaeota archaeon]